MKRFILICCSLVALNSHFFAQEKDVTTPNFSLSVERRSFLLGHPLVFNGGWNVAFCKTFYGNEKHQLVFFPQIGYISEKNIQTRFIVNASVMYRFNSPKRFEAAVFLGANYILSRLAYDNYEYENNILVNKGKYSSWVAPSAGFRVGYKFVKKENYSLSPFIGFSTLRLNKSYVNSLIEGFKLAFSIGITYNR